MRGRRTYSRPATSTPFDVAGEAPTPEPLPQQVSQATGKSWEATIQRSLPKGSSYERIPDLGPAVKALIRSGAEIRFSTRRPYDARIDWRGQCGLPLSIALEAKSTANTTYAANQRGRDQLENLEQLHNTTGVPGLLLLELRGADESERWWWLPARTALVAFQHNRRSTLRLADLHALAAPLPRQQRGRTNLYVDFRPMLEWAELQALRSLQPRII